MDFTNDYTIDKDLQIVTAKFNLSYVFLEYWQRPFHDYITIKTGDEEYMLYTPKIPKFCQKLLFKGNEYIVKITERFNTISLKVNDILVHKLDVQNDIVLDNHDVLLIKYFYFLMGNINGLYKYCYEIDKHVLDFDELFTSEPEFHLVKILEYILFDLYDKLFKSNFLVGLDKYINDNKYQTFGVDNEYLVNVPKNLNENQDYRFIDINFHQLFNNKFLKIFKIDEQAEDEFNLSNSSLVNFYDEATNINTLSLILLHPKFIIGLVNLGPGRGEVRPLYNKFKKSDLNQKLIKGCLEADVQMTRVGIEINNYNEYIYKAIKLDEQQIEFVNSQLLPIEFMFNNSA